ncbi:MAG: hypothetical protein CL433_11135 [Acidimicrobiaceae bacterium]|jgi:hypothetical protein|nr:hypothetical protein [Acidimicrobiaceae bacterium]HAB58897.1 hypothetical protein [Acidimicrobiaceae bacterium]
MQFETYPDCGLDAATKADVDLPRALTDVADLRRRPAAGVWSPLEYACHTRDVISVFEERIRRTATTPGQQLGWWDHDAAVVDSQHNEQEPVLVAEAMAANARRFGRALADLAPAQWDAVADRRPGAGFAIRGMARLVVHEMVHHHRDAEEQLETTVA